MKETIDKMLKHPIRTSIIINAALGGVACIIREIGKLYEIYKDNKGDE